MTRPILFSFFAFLLVFSFPSLSSAKDFIKVGDTIPHDLNLKDQTGKTQSFANLKGEKGLVLVFIRSVEWCPFCQKQLLELNKNAKKFSEAGYPVVTVSYDALPQIEKFVTQYKPDITMLSDPSSESIRAFGILNEANVKGTMSYGIPHPGVYIIDKNKKVQARFFKGDYKIRPSAQELLAKIKELNPPPKPVIPLNDLDNMGEDPIVPGQDVISVPEKIIEPAEAADVTDAPEDSVAPDASMPSEAVLPEATPETTMPEAIPEEGGVVLDKKVEVETMPEKVIMPDEPTSFDGGFSAEEAPSSALEDFPDDLPADILLNADGESPQVPEMPQ